MRTTYQILATGREGTSIEGLTAELVLPGVWEITLGGTDSPTRFTVSADDVEALANITRERS